MKEPLTRSSQFIVQEEKILGYVLSVLFFGLFAYGLIDTIRKKFELNASTVVFVGALAISIVFFMKARSKRVYIRINQRGIYQDERLVSAWDKMIRVYVNQKEKMVQIQDNFQLVIEYWKEDPKKGLRRHIPLTNTQNKSEEDVMAAVIFFWDEYKRDIILQHLAKS